MGNFRLERMGDLEFVRYLESNGLDILESELGSLAVPIDAKPMVSGEVFTLDVHNDFGNPHADDLYYSLRPGQKFGEPGVPGESSAK